MKTLFFYPVIEDKVLSERAELLLENISEAIMQDEQAEHEDLLSFVKTLPADEKKATKALLKENLLWRMNPEWGASFGGGVWEWEGDLEFSSSKMKENFAKTLEDYFTCMGATAVYYRWQDCPDTWLSKLRHAPGPDMSIDNNMDLETFLKMVRAKEEDLADEYSGEQAIEMVREDAYSIRRVTDQTEALCEIAIKDGVPLSYIKNKTDNTCRIAVVKEYAANLKYCVNKTKELCRLAVEENGYSLKYIQDQDEELCKLAVSKLGSALQFCKIQTEEICKIAVQSDPSVLQYVWHQTEELCQLALNLNPEVYVDVRRPDVETYKLNEHKKYGRVMPFIFESEQKAIEEVKNGDALLYYVQNPSPELCKIAIKKNPDNFPFIKQQTEELCAIALKKSGCYLQLVHNQTEKLCLIAVKQDPHSLVYVINQTEAICKAAVQKVGSLLEYVREQTEEICRLAVQQDADALQYVHHQTEEICKLAVQNEGGALQYVHNQTEEICVLAVSNGDALSIVHEQTPRICVNAVRSSRFAINEVKRSTFREKVPEKRCRRD
jgi:hypothetical protein